MRVTLLTLSAFILAAYPFRMPAQWTFLDLPVESQAASVSQHIGTTDITVNYSSPAVKGRTIYGDVVPYDQLWRAGANENTTITISSPVTVEGQALEAGTYGLHLLPTASEWTLVLSKDHTAWGSFFYKKDMDALRVNVKPRACPMTEHLTYGFTNSTANSTTLNLRWAELEVPVNIGVDVHAVVLAGLDAQLRGLTAFNWEPWYEAARYCQDENIAPERAMKWVDVSIARQPNFENQALKATMLEEQGKTAEASALRKGMIDGANNAQLNTYGYQLANQGKTDEAVKMFELNTKRNPKDPNVFDSLGEGYMMAGKNAEAIKAFKKSLGMSPPENVRVNSVRCLKKLGVDTTGYETAKK
ncbi:MAG: DUF2911 domain-containing protein [Flavobacteriales bacterium]|nr:DUF2911 domain-containing protein [Flavobacteriales bacterium]MBP6643516.1 DUF2911 domain-containing protein [Flavobacteriales bacterium]